MVLREYALSRFLSLWVAAGLAAASAGLGVRLASARAEGVTLALVPVAIVAIGSLIASNRAVLVFAAFALCLLVPLPVSDPLPLHAGVQVYPSDLLVVLALVSWAAAWLINPQEARPSMPRTHILNWPLLLFAVTLLAAVIRGHERYGESLFSLPLRILLYAGIAFAISDLHLRDAYRWIVAVFYAGTVWQVGVAIYGYATGTSATNQVVLSTGGERVLAGSTAMFMAGTLLLSLLNLETERSAEGRLSISLWRRSLRSLSSALSNGLPLPWRVFLCRFLLVFGESGMRAAGFLPLLAPVLVLAVLLVPKVDRTFFPTFADRVTASPSTDTSARWRLEAYAAVWKQVRESPLTGVGFGLPVTFVSNDIRYTVAQDPHNQFLYLWAGGGLLLVGSFSLLLAVYLLDAWSRFRRTTIEGRHLIFWAGSLWFVFVINSLTGIILTRPDLLLIFWILMLLPMIVDTSGKRVAT